MATTVTEEKVLVRDCGKVYNALKNPAILYDKADYVLLKIGEKESVHQRYEEMRLAYQQNNLHDIADDLAIIELPANQLLIDTLFQSTGMFKTFIEAFVEQSKDPESFLIENAIDV